MKFKQYLRRCIPALLAVVLVVVLSVPARAADYVVKYPDDYPYILTPTSDGYSITIDTSDSTYWERYKDDDVRFTYTGATCTGSSQERLIDNLSFDIYPMGKDTFVSLTGVDTEQTIKVKLDLDMSYQSPTQTFTMTLQYAYLVLTDTGSVNKTPYITVGSQSFVVGQSDYTWDLTMGPSVSSDSPWAVVYNLDFSGIDNEDANNSVNFTLSTVSSLKFNVSSTVGDSIQNSELKDRLDQMISGGQAGDDLNGAADDLDGTNDELGGSVDDLEDAESNLPTLPDDLNDIVGDYIGDTDEIAVLMPWNDAEYEDFWLIMFTPTLAALSTALVIYFVFGKAKG